jgi:hypothetical protein
MVQLAGERNRAALDGGRLEIVQGSAEALPWEGQYLYLCRSRHHVLFFWKIPCLL